MSGKLGNVSFQQDEGDSQFTTPYSEATARLIDEEVGGGEGVGILRQDADTDTHIRTRRTRRTWRCRQRGPRACVCVPQVNTMVQGCYDRTIQLLTAHRDQVNDPSRPVMTLLTNHTPREIKTRKNDHEITRK